MAWSRDIHTETNPSASRQRHEDWVPSMYFRAQKVEEYEMDDKNAANEADSIVSIFRYGRDPATALI